jgi:transaldolase
MPSLLELLRSTSTQVDCDTLDADVAEEHGPFVDSTSNQAIAYFELSKAVSGQTRLRHDDLIKEAAQDAKDKLWRMFPDVPKTEVLVETLMLKLQFRMMQNLTGFVLVQTNPKLSYSTQGTINNAERLVAVFKAIAPHLNPNRLCIKIPATWEGIQACRDLEKKGIATLATTMFCMEQAVLAADANCTYIAPYVNELKVHFEKG